MTEIQSLLLMKATLESANLHGVDALLDDDCEYVSTGRGIIARNKRESLEFLTAMVDSIQSDHVPVICRVMHITEVYEEGDQYAYMLFVDINEDGRIDRIVSSQENYEFEYDDLRLTLDETPYRFPIVPHTVKDWIAALSIWLETDNFDIDDFYQFIDEDTKVVFQKGDAESITLENGLDVEDYFDQLMNQHFAAVPHIIRDEEDNLILVYGPMSLIVSLNEQGGLAVISIYIDTRDEEESIDEYGYIEEDLIESVEEEPFTDY